MKIKELQNDLALKKLDAVLLFSKDVNHRYFLQKKVDDSLLLISKKGKPILFMNKLEKINTDFKTIVYEDLLQDLKKTLLKLKVKVLGVNEGFITVKQKKKLSSFAKFEDVENLLSNLRYSKELKEINYTKKAVFLTQKILKEIIKDFDFNFEADIVKYIKKRAIDFGCKLSFEPIVASGKNASIPHHNNSGKIKKGFLIIDLGLKYNGYCADITRTFHIGIPNKKEISIYENLLAAQEKAIKKIKPGVKTKDLDLIARNALGKDSKFFIHSLGHGVGLKIHEAPNIGPKSEYVLKKGNIITIEPGIYKNFGIRIEDDILVTKNSYKVLSDFSKKLIIIGDN